MNSHRQWSQTTYGRTYRYGRRGQSFVLMSYNILAQSLLNKHSNLYTAHDAAFLNWPHRLSCIRNEILEIQPKILCLQEVQEEHLGEIERALAPMNYTKPLYKKRTSHEYDDGCAIFYNPQQFELIDHHYVEFYQPNVKLLDRYNVAIIAKFASKCLLDLQMVVATTHLLYNPRRNDIRTAQIQVLLAELDRMAVHTSTQNQLPIIVTGDFNSLTSSAPYCLLQDGHIKSTNLPPHLGITDDCQHVSVAVHQNRQSTALHNSHIVEQTRSDDDITMEFIEQSGLPYNTGSLWHYLNLCSTMYGHHYASTHQDEWITVDYIFYTKFTRRTLAPSGQPSKYSSLQLLANYDLPHKQNCHAMGPIPNQMYGSDHYALASKFVLLVR